MKKKVLIIAYYWPPAGGGGVQRWLKFTKYLRKYGYEPVIFTVKNAEYPVIDESLVTEIPADIETELFYIVSKVRVNHGRDWQQEFNRFGGGRR